MFNGSNMYYLLVLLALIGRARSHESSAHVEFICAPETFTFENWKINGAFHKEMIYPVPALNAFFNSTIKSSDPLFATNSNIQLNHDEMALVKLLVKKLTNYQNLSSEDKQAIKLGTVGSGHFKLGSTSFETKAINDLLKFGKRIAYMIDDNICPEGIPQVFLKIIRNELDSYIKYGEELDYPPLASVAKAPICRFVELFWRKSPPHWQVHWSIYYPLYLEACENIQGKDSPTKFFSTAISSPTVEMMDKN